MLELEAQAQAKGGGPWGRGPRGARELGNAKETRNVSTSVPQG